jgi:hypothetical protein
LRSGEERGTFPGDTRERNVEEHKVLGSPPGGTGEWCSVAEAARRIGVSEKAVRERIKHASIEWRPRGNSGREVLVTPDMERDELSREAPGISPEVVALRVEVARLEERLTSREREGELLRETLTHSREVIGKLQNELAEARKGWLERLLEALRRPTR